MKSSSLELVRALELVRGAPTVFKLFFLQKQPFEASPTPTSFYNLYIWKFCKEHIGNLGKILGHKNQTPIINWEYLFVLLLVRGCACSFTCQKESYHWPTVDIFGTWDAPEHRSLNVLPPQNRGQREVGGPCKRCGFNVFGFWCSRYVPHKFSMNFLTSSPRCS